MTSVKNRSGVPPEEAPLEALLEKIAQGDKAALEECYGRLRSPVFALALATTKNFYDAQDVLQDVFVALFTGAARSYRGSGPAKSFVLSIALNLSRKAVRERKTADLEEEDWMPFVEDPALSPYKRLLVKECLASLDEEERQILLLHAVSGLKHREIAKTLGLTLSAVLSKYSRAVKKLQNKFGKGE